MLRVRGCVFFSRAFNVCFSGQGRAETFAHNRGRENVSDQFPSRPLLLFFPFLSTTMNLSNPRRNAERPPGMGLSNAWQPFPILFLGRVLVLGFLSPTACRSFSRIFPTTSSDTYISRVLFLPSYTYKCWSRRRTIERPIHGLSRPT